MQLNFSACNSFSIPEPNMVCDSIHHKHHVEQPNHVVHAAVLMPNLVQFSIDKHTFGIELVSHQLGLVDHCKHTHRNFLLSNEI